MLDFHIFAHCLRSHTFFKWKHTELCTVEITVLIGFVYLQTVFVMCSTFLMTPFRHSDDLLPLALFIYNTGLTLRYDINLYNI